MAKRVCILRTGEGRNEVHDGQRKATNECGEASYLIRRSPYWVNLVATPSLCPHLVQTRCNEWQSGKRRDT